MEFESTFIEVIDKISYGIFTISIKINKRIKNKNFVMSIILIFVNHKEYLLTV